MTDENLFKQLFDLFNQPGPVNWRLAAEINKHLTGERQPVEPSVADECRDLCRLAEFRVGEASSLPVPTADEVLAVDQREWAERALTGLGYLGDALARSVLVDETQLGPMGAVLKPFGPSLVGVQLGTLVATFAQSAPAAFATGLPLEGPLMMVVPNLERLASENALDPRQTRLWAAANEVAHRTVWRVGWCRDHLVGLISESAETALLDLGSIMGQLSTMQDAGWMDDLADRMDALVEESAVRPFRRAQAAFLSAMAGHGRRLATAAIKPLVPDLAAIESAFDQTAAPSDQPAVPNLLPSEVDAAAGATFWSEVERRFGMEAVQRFWDSPENVPSPSELEDPVGWAARVLLPEF